MRDLRHAQQSIAHIRATAYYELVSACLIRSEFEEAEQYLADLVSFVRTPEAAQISPPSMWDQYASRITLLYGHLAHALGQSQRALDCYRMVCFLEEEENILWTMGKVGEIVLRIGATAISAEERGGTIDVETPEDPNQDNQSWRAGEREHLVEMAARLVDRCLNGGLGDHMAVVGRVIAASLSAEIVRAKYVTLFPLVSILTRIQAKSQEWIGPIMQKSRQLLATFGSHFHCWTISLHPYRLCVDYTGDVQTTSLKSGCHHCSHFHRGPFGGHSSLFSVFQCGGETPVSCRACQSRPLDWSEVCWCVSKFP